MTPATPAISDPTVLENSDNGVRDTADLEHSEIRHQLHSERDSMNEQAILVELLESVDTNYIINSDDGIKLVQTRVSTTCKHELPLGKNCNSALVVRSHFIAAWNAGRKDLLVLLLLNSQHQRMPWNVYFSSSHSWVCTYFICI